MLYYVDASEFGDVFFHEISQVKFFQRFGDCVTWSPSVIEHVTSRIKSTT